MSLGTKISDLRTRAGLSQDALAERLDVSRQSVSKWETDASVPELEKLTKLAQIFGVTLDELVLDKKPQDAPMSAAPAPAPYWTGRRVAGTIFASIGGLTLVLLTVLGGILGVMLGMPLIACGVLCIKCSKRPGLWCAWTASMWFYGFFTIITGRRLRISYLFRWLAAGEDFLFEGVAVSFLVSGAELAVYIALFAWTLWSFRGAVLERTRRNIAVTAALWLAAVALPLICIAAGTAIWSGRADRINWALCAVSALADIGGTATLPAAVTATAALVRGRKRET